MLPNKFRAAFAVRYPPPLLGGEAEEFEVVRSRQNGSRPLIVRGRMVRGCLEFETVRSRQDGSRPLIVRGGAGGVHRPTHSARKLSSAL